MHQLRKSRPLEPGAPLWQRAPTHDTDGRMLSDFMMILPALRHAPQSHVHRVLDILTGILGRYRSIVVFADYNMHLHTLWVSVKPVPGICLELPAVIHHYVPEAKLVNQRAPN